MPLELGAASSATALTAQALRGVLEGIVMQAALEAHFVQYPSARPSLGELAVAAAGLDGHPLATRPELLHRAAIEISQRHPGATADDVLLWAEARSLAA